MPEPRPGLRTVEVYEPPQPQVPVRLNTNECPYPLPPAFVEELAAFLRDAQLHRYPDREVRGLRGHLADRLGVGSEGLWVASGSNEILQQVLLAYGGPGRRALVFEPTYHMYARLAWITHTEVERVPVEAPFVLGPDAVRRAADAAAEVTFVCSPNNPTGNAQPLEVVEELARAVPGLVVVDEAYVEFGGKSAIGLVDSCPNVLVVRTFSKAFALAGARLGYCLAQPAVVEDLRRVRLPYHVSALTQAAGLAALRHAEEAMAILDAVRRQRDRILEELAGLEGVEVFPSDANFVLFRPARAAAEVWESLVERGVLVRDVSDQVLGCLRVTAGTPEEVDQFLWALKGTL
ncbi:MAG: histidinol-phosphate transaminase [Actinomycetota bacterium]|nr:histidinol-phosphate transaminase [Actinomycetota bacterium]